MVLKGRATGLCRKKEKTRSLVIAGLFYYPNNFKKRILILQIFHNILHRIAGFAQVPVMIHVINGLQRFQLVGGQNLAENFFFGKSGGMTDCISIGFIKLFSTSSKTSAKL